MNNQNKKILFLVGGILIILILSVILFSSIGNKNQKNDNNSTTTKKVESQLKALTDNNSNITVEFDDAELANNKTLQIKPVNNVVNISDVVAVYDINLLDDKNNIVKVDNTTLKISIPYENIDGYTSFKVLYLDETNNTILETIPATYNDKYVVFNVKHLSRYAIVAEKTEEETTSTTTTKATTKKTTQKTTTKQQVTTQPETTTKQQTTNQTTTKVQEETTKTTTTKVKTYTYKWTNNCDSLNQCYLIIVDESGNAVNGTVTVTYPDFNKSITKSVSTNGILLEKDIVIISNVKGN